MLRILILIILFVGFPSCSGELEGDTEGHVPSEIQEMVDRIDEVLASWPKGQEGKEWSHWPKWVEDLTRLGDVILWNEISEIEQEWLIVGQDDEYLVASSFLGKGLPNCVEVSFLSLRSRLKDQGVGVRIELGPMRESLRWPKYAFQVLWALLPPDEHAQVFSTLEECALQIWNNSNSIHDLIFCVELWNFLSTTGSRRSIVSDEVGIGEKAAFRLLAQSKFRLLYLQENWGKGLKIDGTNVSWDDRLEDAMEMLDNLCKTSERAAPNWLEKLPALSLSGRKSFLRQLVALHVDPLEDWVVTRPLQAIK